MWGEGCREEIHRGVHLVARSSTRAGCCTVPWGAGLVEERSAGLAGAGWCPGLASRLSDEGCGVRMHECMRARKH